MKQTKKKTGWIGALALILFAAVAMSTFTLVGRLGGFIPDDSGAISLIPEVQIAEPQTEAIQTTTAPVQSTAPQTTAEAPSPAATTAEITEEDREIPLNTAVTAAPNFEVVDNEQIWTTQTQVEIFRISYENGQQEITVNSSDGDKLIAPGTENSYIFKLKNTGNVALDYTVTVDAFITPEGTPIPVTGRLSRCDGKWIVGDRETYGDVHKLDEAEDSATIGAGKYTYYTLDWLWPYDSGDDELDTMLGNIAVDEDLTFTIVISTTAEGNYAPTEDVGRTPPKTGDELNLALWTSLGVGAAVLLVILTAYQIKDTRRNKEAGCK